MSDSEKDNTLNSERIVQPSVEEARRLVIESNGQRRFVDALITAVMAAHQQEIAADREEDHTGDIVLAVDALLNEIAVDLTGNPNATLDAKYAHYVNAVVKAAKQEQAETITALEAECELERMRLAACTTAALGNTPERVAERLQPGHPYYSASYGDVCRAVDREMSAEARLTAVELEKKDHGAALLPADPSASPTRTEALPISDREDNDEDGSIW